jgi:hypothetical protein
MTHRSRRRTALAGRPLARTGHASQLGATSSYSRGSPAGLHPRRPVHVRHRADWRATAWQTITADLRKAPERPDEPATKRSSRSARWHGTIAVMSVGCALESQRLVAHVEDGARAPIPQTAECGGPQQLLFTPTTTDRSQLLIALRMVSVTMAHRSPSTWASRSPPGRRRAIGGRATQDAQTTGVQRSPSKLARTPERISNR